jgi:hypothetical protein
MEARTRYRQSIPIDQAVLLAGSTILTDLCYTILGSISAWLDCIPSGLISRCDRVHFIDRLEL